MRKLLNLVLVCALIFGVTTLSGQASGWGYWQNNNWSYGGSNLDTDNSGGSSNDGGSNSGSSNNGGSSSGGWLNNDTSTGSWGYWNNSSWSNPQPSTPTQPVDPKPVDPKPVDPKPTEPTNPHNPLEPITPEPNKVPRPSSSLTRIEQQLIDLVNEARIANGLKPLQVDMTLVSLAKDKSHEMATTGEVTHYSRTQFNNSLRNAGVNFKASGENIAKAGSVTRVHNGLMNSSGHRANILSSSYTHIGVGIVQFGTMYYSTEIFTGQ